MFYIITDKCVVYTSIWSYRDHTRCDGKCLDVCIKFRQVNILNKIGKINAFFVELMHNIIIT